MKKDAGASAVILAEKPALASKAAPVQGSASTSAKLAKPVRAAKADLSEAPRSSATKDQPKPSERPSSAKSPTAPAQVENAKSKATGSTPAKGKSTAAKPSPAKKADTAKTSGANKPGSKAKASAPKKHWTERPEFLDMSSDIWWRAPGVTAQTSPQGVVTLVSDGQHPSYAMAVAPVNSSVRNQVYRASAIIADAVSEHPGWALLRLEYQAGDAPAVMRDVVFSPVDGAFYAPEQPGLGRLGRVSPRRRGWLVEVMLPTPVDEDVAVRVAFSPAIWRGEGGYLPGLPGQLRILTFAISTVHDEEARRLANHWLDL